MHLTDLQLLHREYLQSPVWKAKRLEALQHHGATCRRCGEPGNDVHHKTYARTGGSELMDDLEVLCRECHEAHHQFHRSCGNRKKDGSVSRLMLARYLTPHQWTTLQSQFSSKTIGELYVALIEGEEFITIQALHIAGKRKVFGKLPRKGMHAIPQTEQSLSRRQALR